MLREGNDAIDGGRQHGNVRAIGDSHPSAMPLPPGIPGNTPRLIELIVG